MSRGFKRFAPAAVSYQQGVPKSELRGFRKIDLVKRAKLLISGRVVDALNCRSACAEKPKIYVQLTAVPPKPGQHDENERMTRNRSSSLASHTETELVFGQQHFFPRLCTALCVLVSTFLTASSVARLSCTSRFLRVRLTLSLQNTPSPGLMALKEFPGHLNEKYLVPLLSRSTAVEKLTIWAQFKWFVVSRALLLLPSSVRELAFECLDARTFLADMCTAAKQCPRLTSLTMRVPHNFQLDNHDDCDLTCLIFGASNGIFFSAMGIRRIYGHCSLLANVLKPLTSMAGREMFRNWCSGLMELKSLRSLRLRFVEVGFHGITPVTRLSSSSLLSLRSLQLHTYYDDILSNVSDLPRNVRELQLIFDPDEWISNLPYAFPTAQLEALTLMGVECSQDVFAWIADSPLCTSLKNLTIFLEPSEYSTGFSSYYTSSVFARTTAACLRSNGLPKLQRFEIVSEVTVPLRVDRWRDFFYNACNHRVEPLQLSIFSSLREPYLETE